MKKLLFIVTLLVALTGSSFATDSVASVTRPVVKGAAVVGKHVVVDTFLVTKHLAKDGFSIVKGVFGGFKHAAGDAKTVVVGKK